jgi:flagellar hook assembly protein FlgD
MPEQYALVIKSKLLQNYPNPFNPETWIPFKLSKAAADVTIKIYNISGQLVRTLDVGQLKSGSYTTRERAAYWDGKNEFGERVASGVYLYSIKADSFSSTRKMVILK